MFYIFPPPDEEVVVRHGPLKPLSKVLRLGLCLRPLPASPTPDLISALESALLGSCHMAKELLSIYKCKLLFFKQKKKKRKQREGALSTNQDLDNAGKCSGLLRRGHLCNNSEKNLLKNSFKTPAKVCL